MFGETFGLLVISARFMAHEVAGFRSGKTTSFRMMKFAEEKHIVRGLLFDQGFKVVTVSYAELNFSNS